MEFYAEVIVRDDPFTGDGEVLHRERLPFDSPTGSLDALAGAARGFGYDELSLTDWYSTKLHFDATSSGGDGEIVVVVFEALGGLKDIAWAGLGALFVKYLLDKLAESNDD